MNKTTQMEKSSRMHKIVKCVRKRLGLSKVRKQASSPLPRQRHLIKPVSTPRSLITFENSPTRNDPAKWREEIDEACDMFENYRTSKATVNLGQLRRQARTYRDELSEMKDEIKLLKKERETLARALTTTKPTKTRKRPAYGDSRYFLKYEKATQLKVNVMKQVMSSPSMKSSSNGSDDRDSAYMSAGSSPGKKQTESSTTLIFESGQYMSNGRNTYYIAV